MALVIKKVRPMFTGVITTKDVFTEADVRTAGGLIDTSKTKTGIREWQKVVAVGAMVKDIKVGDIVLIDPKRYAERKHREGTLKDGIVTDNVTDKYNIPNIEIDGVQYLDLQDIDITHIIDEYEETVDEVASPLMVGKEKTFDINLTK